MQAITDAKRRLLQTAAEKLGNAERITRDETQMKTLLESFKSLETCLKSLLEQLKAKELAEQKSAQAGMHLAQCMASAMAGMDELDEPSYAYQETMQRKSEVVHPSVSYVVESVAINPLEQFIQDRIPQLKRRILEHKNLETDLSSYSRRVKALTDRPDGGASNAELPKLREKLNKVEAEYEQLHQSLLQELLQLEEDKLTMLRPLLVCVMVGEGERQRLVYHDLHAQIHNMRGKPMMNEVEDLVSQGGPERDALIGRSTSRKTIAVPTFKGRLFKSNNTAAAASAPPPQQQAAFATPVVVKQDPYPATPAAAAPATAVVPSPHTSSTPVAAAAAASAAASSSPSSHPPPPPPPPAFMATASSSSSPPPSSSSTPPTPTTTADSSAPFATQEDRRRSSLRPVPAAVAGAVPSPRPSQLLNAHAHGAAGFFPGAVCTATYNYVGSDDGDLSFKAGDRVVMVEELSKGWWNGRLDDGKVGLFPDTYVMIAAATNAATIE